MLRSRTSPRCLSTYPGWPRGYRRWRLARYRSIPVRRGSHSDSAHRRCCPPPSWASRDRRRASYSQTGGWNTSRQSCKSVQQTYVFPVNSRIEWGGEDFLWQQNRFLLLNTRPFFCFHHKENMKRKLSLTSTPPVALMTAICEHWLTTGGEEGDQEEEVKERMVTTTSYLNRRATIRPTVLAVRVRNVEREKSM